MLHDNQLFLAFPDIGNKNKTPALTSL